MVVERVDDERTQVLVTRHERVGALHAVHQVGGRDEREADEADEAPDDAQLTLGHSDCDIGQVVVSSCYCVQHAHVDPVPDELERVDFAHAKLVARQARAQLLERKRIIVFILATAVAGICFTVGVDELRQVSHEEGVYLAHGLRELKKSGHTPQPVEVVEVELSDECALAVVERDKTLQMTCGRDRVEQVGV